MEIDTDINLYFCKYFFLFMGDFIFFLYSPYSRAVKSIFTTKLKKLNDYLTKRIKAFKYLINFQLLVLEKIHCLIYIWGLIIHLFYPNNFRLGFKKNKYWAMKELEQILANERKNIVTLREIFKMVSQSTRQS